MDEIDRLTQVLATLWEEMTELRKQFEPAHELYVIKFKQMVDVNNQIRELKEKNSTT